MQAAIETTAIITNDTANAIVISSWKVKAVFHQPKSTAISWPLPLGPYFAVGSNTDWDGRAGRLVAVRLRLESTSAVGAGVHPEKGR